MSLYYPSCNHWAGSWPSSGRRVGSFWLTRQPIQRGSGASRVLAIRPAGYLHVLTEEANTSNLDDDPTTLDER